MKHETRKTLVEKKLHRHQHDKKAYHVDQMNKRHCELCLDESTAFKSLYIALQKQWKRQRRHTFLFYLRSPIAAAYYSLILDTQVPEDDALSLILGRALPALYVRVYYKSAKTTIKGLPRARELWAKSRTVPLWFFLQKGCADVVPIKFFTE